jgi:hypothetical protein
MGTPFSSNDWQLFLEFGPSPFEFLHDLGGFLELHQRLKLAADIPPVELAGLANDEAESPLVGFAESLKFGGGSDNLIHGLQLS